MRNQASKRINPRLGIFALILGLFIDSTATAQQLNSDFVSGQTVGTTIQWPVSHPAPGKDYRLSASKLGSPPKVIYDFSDDSTWDWTPMADGPYSAPQCLQGLKMRVNFFSFNPRRTHSTNYKPSDSQHSMNFYLGGMLAQKDYFVAHEIGDAEGKLVERGPTKLHFTTSIPVEIPVTIVDTPASLDASLLESLVLVSPLNFIDDSAPQIPFAADLSGRVVWYYDRTFENRPRLFRANKGGTFLMVEDVDGVEGQTLVEIDIAGRVVRKTNAKRISEQIEAPFPDPVTSFITRPCVCLMDARQCSYPSSVS